MAPPRLTPALAGEYQQLFDTCTLRPQAEAQVAAILRQIERDQPRYQAVAAPPFAWEESSEDVLRLKNIDRWHDWSLPGTLYKLEGYNGWGYRQHHPEVLTPYLWSGSNHYQSGKYVADERWSDSAVSRQIGAAALLRRMAETGLYLPPAKTLPAATAPDRTAAPEAPPLRYSPDIALPHAEALQNFLNTLPGIYLKPDGKLGPRSSEAFRLATGRYLAGDAREQ